MAKVNNESGYIEFDLNELNAAWENAPKIINKNSDEFRLCYICKYYLEKEKFAGILNDGFSWVIDLINAKKPKLENSNYIAIHQNCISNRYKLDSTKLLKKIKSLQWQFSDENS